jgi:hypothetical protein
MSQTQHQPRNVPEGDRPRPGERRTSGRPVDDLLRVAWRLQPRDYVLAHLLDEHRFLTTDQVAAVLYHSPRTCRNRLDLLRRLGFVTWFLPVHPRRGRLPLHWVPGPLSARYVALYHGRPVPTDKALRDDRDRLPALATRTSHLAHDDGVHQFFVDLLAHSRTRPRARLLRWWSAAHIARAVNHNSHPDGHGVWRDGDRVVAFFLEHDNGTESHPVRAAKLAAYRTVRDKDGPAWPVLFWLPNRVQEAHLHDYLAGDTGGLVVATAARDAAAGPGPAGPVWRVVGDSRARLRLADLPDRPADGGPYHPGPPDPEDDPLYLLCDDPDPQPR